MRLVKSSAIAALVLLGVMACAKRPVDFNGVRITDPTTVTIANILEPFERTLTALNVEANTLFVSGLITREQAKWWAGLSEQAVIADEALAAALRIAAVAPTVENSTNVASALNAFNIAFNALLEYHKGMIADTKERDA